MAFRTSGPGHSGQQPYVPWVDAPARLQDAGRIWPAAQARPACPEAVLARPRSGLTDASDQPQTEPVQPRVKVPEMVAVATIVDRSSLSWPIWRLKVPAK